MGADQAPAVATGFAWREELPGGSLVCPALEPLAAHVFTTRALTFRGERQRDDYGLLARRFGVSSDQIVRVRQVHGRAVVVVRPGEPVSQLDADAIVSSDLARLITVRVADCVPILLADRSARVVAAIHAGWRGTCAGVTRAAVDAMAELGVAAQDLVAAIGPSIGPCCYQVDDRVRGPFLAATPESAAWFTEDGVARWRLDLWQANADQLESAGVPAESIHIARLCTADHLETFYSFRKEGENTGRIVAAIRSGSGRV
jgi:hypothetical protein